MLAKSFLIVSAYLCMSCAENLPPLVSIVQLDTVHNKANPFKITKYDTDKCVLEIKEAPSITLLGPEMHGAYCLTKEDYAAYKAHFQAECKGRQLEKFMRTLENK